MELDRPLLTNFYIQKFRRLAPDTGSVVTLLTQIPRSWRLSRPHLVQAQGHNQCARLVHWVAQGKPAVLRTVGSERRLEVDPRTQPVSELALCLLVRPRPSAGAPRTVPELACCMELDQPLLTAPPPDVCQQLPWTTRLRHSSPI